MVFQSWFYRTMSLNFYIQYINSSICVRRNLVSKIFGRSHLLSQYLQILRRALPRKPTTLLVFHLWFVKSLKNLQILGLLITSRNKDFFLIYNIWIRYSQSTADLLTVVMIELLGLLIDLGLLELQHLIDPRVRVWHSGLLHKLKSYGISSRMVGFITYFLSNIRLRVVLDGTFPRMSD